MMVGGPRACAPDWTSELMWVPQALRLVVLLWQCKFLIATSMPLLAPVLASIRYSFVELMKLSQAQVQIELHRAQAILGGG